MMINHTNPSNQFLISVDNRRESQFHLDTTTTYMGFYSLKPRIEIFERELNDLARHTSCAPYLLRPSTITITHYRTRN